MKNLFIGQKFSVLRKFSKEDVQLFSNLCGDKNPLHLDEEFAKKTIFKKPICHGMLGSSLFSNIMGNNITGSIYLSQTLKFLKPVYIDEEIEALVEINGFIKEKNTLILKTYVIKTTNRDKAIDGDAIIKIPKNQYIESDKKQSKGISNNNDDGINSENLNGNHENMFEFTKNDVFQLKIYETYFIKHITLHFDRVFKVLIKNEEMYLSYIKFKNMYMIDLSSETLIFDLLACRKSEKNIKLYKNQKLWQEILYHSKSLLESYRHDHGINYSTSDSNFRFLPILGGLSIVHVYSQKKLSRMTENSDNNVASKNYKEIDILYGYDIKNNSNIEFRYSEPKKLQDIEKFFTEFYIGIRTGIGIYSDPVHELHYLDYSIITTINDILINDKQSLNGSKNSIEQILHKINLKLYEKFINMQNGQESLPSGNAVKSQKNPSSATKTGNPAVTTPPTLKPFNNQKVDNGHDKNNLNNNKENSNYLKINNFNILKELFNTFEIFNKSEYENLNSKNGNNSEDNDGWIFQRDINKQTLYKETHQLKNIAKENNNDVNNDSKSELNLNRFKRFNSNLNSVGVKNEREKFEYSDKHNVAKKSTINVVYNAYAGGHPAAGGSNSPRNWDLNKKGTNGSKGNYNNINDTIVDMKNRRIGNDMNTIVLSRIDHNETIKHADNNDFSVDSLSLIDKDQNNSDSVIFNKINTHLKNEKSQTIDNLMDELFYDKEKQNFLEKKNSSKRSEKVTDKDETETFNNKKLQIVEADRKESDKQCKTLLENSKIRKNNIDRIEGKDNKNHIFETDFPEEDEINKDIRYNHNLLAKYDINKLNQNKNLKKNINNDYDYNAIDNGNNTVNKFNGDEDFFKNNLNNINFFKKNYTLNNNNVQDENPNFNVGLKIKSNIDLNYYYKDNLDVDEYGRNVLKKHKSIENNNKTDELHLNIYTKKQMSLNNPYINKEENGKLRKYDRITKLQEKLFLKDDGDLHIKANSQLNLIKIDKITNEKNNYDTNKVIINEKKNMIPCEKNTQVDQPLLIKIEGKSIEMQKKKLLDRNESITVFAHDNDDSNNKLFNKEKLKENNFLKANKNVDGKNKNALNNQMNARNKLEDTSGNDFIY